MKSTTIRLADGEELWIQLSHDDCVQITTPRQPGHLRINYWPESDAHAMTNIVVRPPVQAFLAAEWLYDEQQGWSTPDGTSLAEWKESGNPLPGDPAYPGFISAYYHYEASDDGWDDQLDQVVQRMEDRIARGED